MAEQFEQTRQLAEQGDANAQFQVGYGYCDGIEGVVEEDQTQAVEWFGKAANQGHADAQCMLGSCYDFGHGIDQDHSKAVYWYSQAAQQGHALAQWRLGIAYQEERGVDRDLALAMEWTDKAAKQGVVSANEAMEGLQRQAEQEQEAALATPEEQEDDDNLGKQESGAIEPVGDGDVGSSARQDEIESTPVSKPFYRQTWFIVVVVVVLLGALIGGIAGGVAANRDNDDDGDTKDSGLSAAPTKAPTSPTPAPTAAPTGTPWVSTGLEMVGINSYFAMGESVAMSGDGTVVVGGAPDGDCVQARKFNEATGAWERMGQDLGCRAAGSSALPFPLEGNRGQLFGSSVALSEDGNTVAIGAEWHVDVSSSTGRNIGQEGGTVYVLRFNGTHWNSFGNRIKEFKFDSATGAWAGSSVSLSDNGEILAVGIPYMYATVRGWKAHNPGYVDIFRYDAGTNRWQPYGVEKTGFVRPPDHLAPFSIPYMSMIIGESHVDLFGYAVSLNGAGNRVAVGAPHAKNSNGVRIGHIGVYELNPGTGSWDLVGTDIDGKHNSRNFGSTVSLSKDGTTVAGGTYEAPISRNNHAVAYRLGTTSSGKTDWIQLGQPIEQENGHEQIPAASVALTSDGNTMVVGNRDTNSVRVFEYSTISKTWVQFGNAMRGEFPREYFGHAVAAAEKDGFILVAVGAPEHSGDQEGVYSMGLVNVFRSPR